MQESRPEYRLHYANSQYPSLLREMEYSPPRQLYVRGNLESIPLVAIVGARRPTDYGKYVTFTLARELVTAGLGVVSGLAIGIDSWAHRGALDAKGYTVGVLASGLGPRYPSINKALGSQIVASGGALVSEYEPETPSYKQNFPARNRIIAGLSLAVIVTEAAIKSGAFHTTAAALSNNRMVMAVPGNIDSRLSHGTNQLIREGAIPITNAQNVLDELGLQEADVRRNKPSLYKDSSRLTSDEAQILKLISAGTNKTDSLIKAMGLSPASFAQAITRMEISGHVRNLGSGIWVTR